jgi:3-methyladenine DNA glycosylase/8-oxoguanine DNA glycosylase
VHRYSYNIITPLFFNLKTTCHMHGWVNLAPFSWSTAEQTLGFAILLDDSAVEIRIKQLNDSTLQADIFSLGRLGKTQKQSIDKAIGRALDLNNNTAELLEISRAINNQYGELVKKGAGRLLRAATLWEDAAKTLFTTNCSWHLTRQMCSAACSSSFITTDVPGQFPFPAAKKIARISEAKLKEKMRVGYRAGFIKKLAGQLANNSRLAVIEAMDEKALRNFFASQAGFGPYATNHMMNLSGYYDQIPVDSVVRAYVLKFHGTEECAAFIEDHFARWSRYRWWGLKLEQIANHANWLGDL